MMNFFKKLFKQNENNAVMPKAGLTGGASLKFSVETDKNKALVEKKVREIAVKNFKTPLAILDCAKKEGCNFYFLKNADKILKPIGESSGLIFPKTGMGALYLNFFTTRKISLKSNIMFVFDFEKLNLYTILYNYHKFSSYSAMLPGFDQNSLKRLKDLDRAEKEESLNKMDYKEIICFKEAIARDKEAAEFVVNFMKEIEGGKNAFNSIKREGGASV